jgi:glycosyltransferase involved in cell wall biosynthesis
MKELPRITVVTPSFNQGQFLRETIESVLNQDYPNLEYFIVDGGSNDDSVEIIKEYEDRIDWWVSEKDNGQTDAICKGFNRATGNLLGWLNSDDVYFPGALQKIGEAYLQNPSASIYAGGIAIGMKGDKGIKKCSIPTSPLKIFSLYGLLGFGQQSSFFNAEAYCQIGGLNREIYMRMDGDIMYRLMKHNPTVIIIDNIVGFFRWHDKSKSSISANRYLSERENFIKSLEISRIELHVRNVIFKIYRFFRGGYLKSYLATRRYNGKRMTDVWINDKYSFTEKSK